MHFSLGWEITSGFGDEVDLDASLVAFDAYGRVGLVCCPLFIEFSRSFLSFSLPLSLSLSLSLFFFSLTHTYLSASFVALKHLSCLSFSLFS